MDNKIIQLLKKTKSSAKSGSLVEISQSLKEIKNLLIVALLGDSLESITEALGKSPEPPKKPEPPKERRGHDEKSMDILKDVATTQNSGEAYKYLLHRPMDSYEYDSSDAEGNNELTLDKETEWWAESDGWQDIQDGNSPVVSCWIPGSAIIDVINPEPNVGTWGEIGENPNYKKIKVSVKPGTYKIYQELRQ